MSREWWSWITRGIKLFNHSQFFSIRQNTTRFFTTVGLHMISVFLSSDLNCCIISHHGFVFSFCLLRPQCIIQEALNLYSNTIISSFYWSLLHVLKYNNQLFLLQTLFFIFDHSSDTLTKHRHWLENRKYRHCKGNKSPETITRPR